MTNGRFEMLPYSGDHRGGRKLSTGRFSGVHRKGVLHNPFKLPGVTKKIEVL